MPTAYIKKLAKLNNISIDKIENLWSQAKEIAKSEGNGKAWGLITTIFQNKLKEKGYKIKADTDELDDADLGVNVDSKEYHEQKSKMRSLQQRLESIKKDINKETDANIEKLERIAKKLNDANRKRFSQDNFGDKWLHYNGSVDKNVLLEAFKDGVAAGYVGFGTITSDNDIREELNYFHKTIYPRFKKLLNGSSVRVYRGLDFYNIIDDEASLKEFLDYLKYNLMDRNSWTTSIETARAYTHYKWASVILRMNCTLEDANLPLSAWLEGYWYDKGGNEEINLKKSLKVKDIKCVFVGDSIKHDFGFDINKFNKVTARYEPDGHLSYYDYVKQAIREIWARGIPNNIENYWVNIYRDLITACISEGIEPKVCARMCYIKYHKENPQTKHLNDNLDVSFNTLKKEAIDYFKAVKKPLTYSDLRSAESTLVFYDNLKKKLKEYEHRRNIVGSFKEEVFEDNGIKYHFQRLSLKEAKHYIDDLITSNSWNDKTQFREIYDDSDIVNLYVEYNNGTKFDSSDGLMKNLKSTGIKNAIFEYESYTAYCGNDCHIEKFDEQQDAPYVVKCEASMLRKYKYKGNSIFASTKDEAIEILSSVLSRNVKKFCSLGQEESERLADYINNFEDSNLKRLYDKCLEASKVTQEFEEEAKKVIRELDKIHPSVRLAASSEEITAGLIWGVEGLEKLKKFGEVLFYIVNGVRYGVKPHRGAKHDIEWYYNQLKAGMEADKGYSVGLTQYLNAWIRKKELDVVFKGKA